MAKKINEPLPLVLLSLSRPPEMGLKYLSIEYTKEQPRP